MASVLRTLRHRRSPSELPSFDCIEVSGSVGSDDSQSSLEAEEDEMLFNSRVPETFPLCRNTYQRRVEARRSVLMKICVATFVVATLLLNYSGFWSASHRRNSGASHDQSSQTARVARRLTLEAEQVHSLKNLVDERKIQESSLQKVEATFGSGPHLVEFEINIWGDDNRPEKLFFTVEMAPMVRLIPIKDSRAPRPNLTLSQRLMPTSVFYFLQQIEKGLWDSSSIHMNTDHVIAAQPAHGNGVSLMKQFDESGVGSLPFVEYSNAYPHAPYTLGFVRTGPAFFINKKWNSHRDACFAKVVVGRQTIDRIAALRGHDQDPTRIRPVDIVAARRVQWRNLNERAKVEYASHSTVRR